MVMKESVNSERGMNFDEFKYFLTRISVKNRGYFEKVYDKFKSDEVNQSSTR
jgi:hypothetical protein